MYKCRWTHCKHDSRDIPNGEEVHGNGSAYYHKDCWDQKTTIDSILTTWSENIDAFVNMATLRSIVNNLVFKRGYDEHYILYLVKIGAREKWLHYPYGLYKVVSQQRFIDDFNSMKAKQKIKDIKQEEVGGYEVDTGFKYGGGKKKGFGRILGR